MGGDEEIRVETSGKRVRAMLGGHVVADTRRPVLVWEHPYYPTYYVPRADVRAELSDTGEVRHSRRLGEGTIHDVVTDSTTAPAAAIGYRNSPVAELRELVRLDWNSMDEWFEEDEPVYVHPRDPYKRVDILESSRHVQVRLDGVTVADSHHPRILFETGLPPRYYLPLPDVRMDLLRPSDHETHCPYKGTAGYWHVHTGEAEHPDTVWTYRTPLPESHKIAGLACFYDERVDILLDGEPQRRPETPFS
ncbi:Uncharacterized conserved protein, DUF427 family [Actinopolyspora mzabensis]|uniref:Uncharacterized conserved protein, DUF427 family n=1 Tax=Actinopolyspora mzabensis TaxID=995066 RepID=A0A1G9EL93_ACTMZ|nr:DUF427 domain-containing protein [Actinopolyspora mzabensis]SDK76930.1 Uncharacterized conserved protein, DUF427 family [Actinopolyspora mzabensis]